MSSDSAVSGHGDGGGAGVYLDNVTAETHSGLVITGGVGGRSGNMQGGGVVLVGTVD